MKENFIIRFLKLKKEINADTMSVNHDGTPSKFSDEALECFRLLNNYVMGAHFNPTKRNKELMRLIDHSNAEIAQRLGISENTVRSQKSVAAKKLEEQIGSDCFSVIRYESGRQLNILTTKLKTFKGYNYLEDWLPQELVNQHVGCDTSFDIIKSCGRELRVLAMLDKSVADKYTDPKKLAFLLEILSGNQVVGCKATRGHLLHIMFNLQKEVMEWVDEEEIDKDYW